MLKMLVLIMFFEMKIRKYLIFYLERFQKVNENYNSLYDIGFYLGKKYDQSINKRYFEKFF